LLSKARLAENVRGGCDRSAMAKLTVQIKGELKEFSLGSFLLSIGRRPDNNIVLDDKFVSASHAVVGFDADRHYVEDLKSSNGTLLNGAPVQRAPLKDGDVLTVGTHEIRFVEQAAKPIPLPGAPPATAIDPSATAEAELLDELIGSIRTHRERERSEREASAARIRGEWGKVLQLAEQLKDKIGGDPRVKYFGIDRKAEDVMIRIQRYASSPPSTIVIARRHPDYRGDHVLQGIWLLRSGEPERCLPSAQAIATEVVRELAFLLA
jgi:hypothetical protein